TCSLYVPVLRLGMPTPIDPALVTLASYPWVTVRVACNYCKRHGRYRLARMAERYGAETTCAEVLRQLAGDCPHTAPNKYNPKGCGVHLPDLFLQSPPPDESYALVVIQGGRR